MKRNRSLARLAAITVAGTLLAASHAEAQNVRITGAGSSFVFPLFAAWFQEYSEITPGVRVDYQSTGSGAGVQALVSRTVDFAASDSAMSDEQIAQVENGVVVLPVTAGTIVFTYNLPGITELRLPRDVYPAIYTGEVTRWNDERIVAANPDLELPDLPITAVRRSDSSGTTYVFTKHLSAVNETFAEQMGVGTTVQWPNVSNIVGAPRNDGVAATVLQTPGGVGYVEYGFAELSGQPMALLENASGEFVAASTETAMAALAAADLTGDDLRIWVEDPSAADAYPIATFSWMLLYREHGDKAVAAALRDLVAWTLEDGQTMAEELGYIPLPPEVVERVQAEIPSIQ